MVDWDGLYEAARAARCPTPQKWLYRNRKEAERRLRLHKGDDALQVYACRDHYHIGHPKGTKPAIVPPIGGKPPGRGYRTTKPHRRKN